jgi:hypothetical protein
MERSGLPRSSQAVIDAAIAARGSRIDRYNNSTDSPGIVAIVCRD